VVLKSKKEKRRVSTKNLSYRRQRERSHKEKAGEILFSAEPHGKGSYRPKGVGKPASGGGGKTKYNEKCGESLPSLTAAKQKGGKTLLKDHSKNVSGRERRRQKQTAKQLAEKGNPDRESHKTGGNPSATLKKKKRKRICAE